MSDHELLCPHFHEHRQTLRSKEITGARGHSSTVIAIPWCGHDSSPAPFYLATTVIGGAGILRCGGDLEKCQVK